MFLQAAKPPEVFLQVCLQLLVPHGAQVGVETPPGGEAGAPPHLHVPGGRGLPCEGGWSAGAGGGAGLTGRVWGGTTLAINQQLQLL